LLPGNASRTGQSPAAMHYYKNMEKKREQKNTRNSSGEEIANMNFLYNDIVHALQNTIDWCINSATDRRGYLLERRFTKFREMTQCNSHYAVQGHSRSPFW